MTRVEILTADTTWAAKYGTPGRQGRTVIEVAAVERLTFAKVSMIRFDLATVAKRLPRDCGNRWYMAPAVHEVTDV